MERIKTGRKARYSFKRKRTKRVRRNKLYTYDLETTLIDEGTPELKYFTAYIETEKEKILISERVTSLDELAKILEEKILLPEYKGAKFIAHNANKFDVYFVMPALESLGYLIEIIGQPGKSPCAFIVSDQENPKMKWFFQDSMRMTGIQKKLEDFVESFAPGYVKTDIGLATGTEFDPYNPVHIKYAENDVIILHEAINNFENLLIEKFGLASGMTIGGAAIKSMEMFLPKKTDQGNDLCIWNPPPECMEAVRESGYRGGYCWCMGIYEGECHKWDLNQAYGAAMREATLPAGRCVNTFYYRENKCGFYHVNAHCDNKNKIPFYYRNFETGKQYFSAKEINDGVIGNNEYDQLISEGWEIEILNGWYWTDTFSLIEWVNELEKLRFSDPEGPSGPIGLMAKALGNNAYGKTVEILQGLDIIYSSKPVPGYIPYQEENPNYKNILCKKSDRDTYRGYHKPQLGGIITEYVRMVVRRAALLAGDNFLYADTDCIAAKEPIEGLDVDSRRYGAWKLEGAYVLSIFVEKKIYAIKDKKKKDKETGVETLEWDVKFKGLRHDNVGLEDIINAQNRRPVTKTQLQRNSVMKVLAGSPMFRSVSKTGNKSMVQRE